MVVSVEWHWVVHAAGVQYMFIATYIVVALVALVVAMRYATKVRQQRENVHVNHRATTFIFQKVFGLHLAVARWIGNCFAPAIVLVWHGRSTQHKRLKTYPAWLVITLRSRNHLETTIYYRGGLRFDWNSEHIARKYGIFHEGSESGHPESHTYHGTLGNHLYV